MEEEVLKSGHDTEFEMRCGQLRNRAQQIRELKKKVSFEPGNLSHQPERNARNEQDLLQQANYESEVTLSSSQK